MSPRRQNGPSRRPTLVVETVAAPHSGTGGALL